MDCSICPFQTECLVFGRERVVPVRRQQRVGHQHHTHVKVVTSTTLASRTEQSCNIRGGVVAQLTPLMTVTVGRCATSMHAL